MRSSDCEVTPSVHASSSQQRETFEFEIDCCSRCNPPALSSSWREMIAVIWILLLLPFFIFFPKAKKKKKKKTLVNLVRSLSFAKLELEQIPHANEGRQSEIVLSSRA